ncbi:MAG: hypothetical protein GY834_03765 [Bacteroidetes bacterium]|nr:hypothetical protein [Bacteroidota bacterium]
MKIKNIIYSTLAIIALGLSSCSKDKTEEIEPLNSKYNSEAITSLNTWNNAQNQNDYALASKFSYNSSAYEGFENSNFNWENSPLVKLTDIVENTGKNSTPNERYLEGFVSSFGEDGTFEAKLKRVNDTLKVVDYTESFK